MKSFDGHSKKYSNLEKQIKSKRKYLKTDKVVKELDFSQNKSKTNNLNESTDNISLQRKDSQFNDEVVIEIDEEGKNNECGNAPNKNNLKIDTSIVDTSDNNDF